jgi:hypothetical protein
LKRILPSAKRREFAKLGLQGATLIGNPGGECGVNLISQLGKFVGPTWI